MIYTLTTNPAVDLNMTAHDVKPRQVNRTSNAVYSPNGKGINVSLVLKHFGVTSKVLGFFGGFTGRYILGELEARGVAALPVEVEDTTRINLFVNDGASEYKFVNAGSFVSKEKQSKFLTALRALEDCDYLVVSGSLPQGIAPSYYDEILRICAEKQTRVILDISSAKLKDLLKYRPLLIKPNDEEIRDIFGIELRSEPEIIRALRFLREEGAQNVLLTMGEKGSYFSGGQGVYACGAQPVRLVSSACAGDAALGAFLSEWLTAGDIEAALKKSAAAGANVAESDALGDFAKVADYMENIKIRKVGE